MPFANSAVAIGGSEAGFESGDIGAVAAAVLLIRKHVSACINSGTGGAFLTGRSSCDNQCDKSEGEKMFFHESLEIEVPFY